jgi:hypothetical protein
VAITELLLEVLGPSARAALPYVRSLVEAGLGANEIQDALKGTQYALRRTVLLDMRRAILDIVDTRPFLQNLRNDLRPDPSRLPPPLTTTLRKYSFTVSVRGTDTETGEPTTRRISISTDTLLTGQELKDKALSIADDVFTGKYAKDTLSGIEPDSAVVLDGTNDPNQ